MQLKGLLMIHGVEVPYELKRSARRSTLGLTLRPEGLTIHVPTLARSADVTAFVQSRHDWIAKHWVRQQNRENRAQTWSLQTGAYLPWRGQHLVLQVEAGPDRIIENANVLCIQTHDPDNTMHVRQQLIRWIMQQAMPIFAAELEFFAKKMPVPCPRFGLSNAKGRWGSCRSDGLIRLNWRLMLAAPGELSYVVAHELAHLKEMNHSPQFWAWVEKLCPDYLFWRAELKAHGSSYMLLG